MKFYIRILLRFARHIVSFFQYGRNSYSQEGEDLILNRLFANKAEGFYIDVGAHHPYRFSNTYLFYLNGWTGINIDAMPGSMSIFNRKRPKDINLEIPILDKEGTMTYYQFNEPALNGFSSELSNDRNENTKYRIINSVDLYGYPLSHILEKYLSAQVSQIDFMSVDVEGLDLEVLKSNNWDKFRPNVLLVELLNSSLDSIALDPVYQFLSEKNYFVFSKCVKTVIFVSAEYKTSL